MNVHSKVTHKVNIINQCKNNHKCVKNLHNVSTWLKHFQEKYVSNHEKKRKEKKRKEKEKKRKEKKRKEKKRKEKKMNSASINRKKSITSNSSYVIRLLVSSN